MVVSAPRARFPMNVGVRTRGKVKKRENVVEGKKRRETVGGGKSRIVVLALHHLPGKDDDDPTSAFPRCRQNQGLS